MNDIRPGDPVAELDGRTGVVTASDGPLNVWVADARKPGVERSVLTSRLRRLASGGQS